MRRTLFLLTGLTLIAIMLIAGCTQADNLAVEEAWARPGIQDANSAVYFIVSNATSEGDTLLSAESDIATAVELHESMIKTVDEGQGEMVKLMEDESHEHMEDHHQDCEIEDHEHEGSKDCEDHHEDGEHHDDHHGDGDMEDHHAEGEHHDNHHEDGDMEDHHEEGEHHNDHHADANVGENAMETSMMAGMEGGVMMMVQQENVPVSAESQVEFKPGGLHVMLIGLKQDLNPGDTFAVTLNFENAGQITLDVPVREP